MSNMAIISAFTLIRALALFHLTLAFLFLTNPHYVADHNMTFILGEAMGLVSTTCFCFPEKALLTAFWPEATSFNKPTPATAFLAVILALLGLSDLTAVSMNEEVALLHWSSQTPVRLFFLFVLTGYTYAFKPGGIMASSGWNYKKSVGDHLKNNMVFTFGFLEVVMWFWVRILVFPTLSTQECALLGC